jgi:Zn-dependent protease with chaperone function
VIPSGRSEPTQVSEQPVLETLTLLPSESTIHFLVYCSLLCLALPLVIGIPAIVLFFAEHRPMAGVFFVSVNVAIFVAIFLRELKRKFDVPRPRFWEMPARSVMRLLRRIDATRPLANRIGNLLSPSFVPFPDPSGTSSFLEFYRDAWRRASGGAFSAPRLYWSYQDRHAIASASGRSHNPVVAISAGLVSPFPGQRGIAEVYLFHEFGHIVNRDLEIFALAVSASHACSGVMVASSVLSAGFLVPFFKGDIRSALILLVAVMWLLCLGFLWLLLARYAGVVISLRELYADVFAALGLGELSFFENVLSEQGVSRSLRLWRKFRSLLSLRLIHLSPGERLVFLKHPESLLYPRHRYYVLTGTLLVVLQSNPFGEGYENYWMRWLFLLAWAPVCLAYAMNVGRAIEGVASTGEKLLPWPSAAMWLGVTATLILPMFKVPGLYCDLVLSAGKWEVLRLAVRDSVMTLYAQWAHVQFLAVPIVALVWLSVSYWLARRRLAGSDRGTLKVSIAGCDRAFFIFSLIAVLAETLLIGVGQYGSIEPSILDTWQEALGKSRALPPLVALSLLVIGSFWIWRRADLQQRD